MRQPALDGHGHGVGVVVDPDSAGAEVSEVAADAATEIQREAEPEPAQVPAIGRLHVEHPFPPLRPLRNQALRVSGIPRALVHRQLRSRGGVVQVIRREIAPQAMRMAGLAAISNSRVVTPSNSMVGVNRRAISRSLTLRMRRCSRRPRAMCRHARGRSR